MKGIQKAVHRALEKFGFRVYVCWHLKQAEKIFERERKLQAERLSKAGD